MLKQPVRASYRLFGAFSLTIENGVSIAPQSSLRIAMLAVLLTSAGYRRSRKYLQSLFWSQSTDRQSSASLRNTIYMLRRDLKSLGADAISADAQSLSLDPKRFADLGQGDGEFLEGLDLGLSGAEGFEDWLREQRQSLKPEPKQRSAPALVMAWRRSAALGLLPTIGEERDLASVDHLVDEAVRHLAALTSLDVHDLRQTTSPNLPEPVDLMRRPSHWLQGYVARPNGKPVLTLRMTEVESRRLIWVSEPFPETGPSAPEMSVALGDLILDRLLSNPDLADSKLLFPATAIKSLFSLDSRVVARVDRRLGDLVKNEDAPIFHCIHAFSQVFMANEGLGHFSVPDMDRLLMIVSGMGLTDPLRPLCQSLVGYAVHMFHGENDLALSLVEDARRAAPRLALNLDHLAVLEVMQGNLDQATEAFEACMRYGAMSPWRYTYDVTGAMIQLAKGEGAKALYHSNQALFRKPRYLAALRYALAAMALYGRPQDARRMLTQINQISPGFDMADWAHRLIGRAAPSFSGTMVQGFKQVGIL